MSLTVKILNGSQVPYDCVVLVSQRLFSLTKDPQVLFELVKKCQNENYQWNLRYISKTILQKIDLVNQNGTIDQDVKKSCFAQ